MANYLVRDITHTTWPLVGEKYRFGLRLYQRLVGSIAECDEENDPYNLIYGQTMYFRKFRDGEVPENFKLKTAVAAEPLKDGSIKIKFSDEFEVLFEPVSKYTRTFYAADPLTELGLRK